MTGIKVPLWDLGIISLCGIVAGIWAGSCPALLQFGVLLVLYGIPTFRWNAVLGEQSIDLDASVFVVVIGFIFPCRLQIASRVLLLHRHAADPFLSPSACNRCSRSHLGRSDPYRFFIHSSSSSSSCRETLHAVFMLRAVIVLHRILLRHRCSVFIGLFFFRFHRIKWIKADPFLSPSACGRRLRSFVRSFLLQVKSATAVHLHLFVRSSSSPCSLHAVTGLLFHRSRSIVAS